MRLIWHWIVSTLALLVVAWLFRGVHLSGLGTALVAAFVLGVVNTLIKPILSVLTFPITIFTFGLFALVLNALMLLLTSHVVRGFTINGFGTAFLASIVLSIVSSVLHSVLERRD